MKIRIKYEIIIDRYGQGHAAAVCKNNKIIDCFIDPPLNAIFYPPNTFLQAKIERKISTMGSYFVRLPNGRQGLLKSKNNYAEGKLVKLQSKVFYDLKKPQIFTDSLKITSKHFIFKLGQKGISFSKKLKKKFDREGPINLIKANSNIFEDTFVIFRSSIADICRTELKKELDKTLLRLKEIKNSSLTNQIYFDGLAKNVALEKYNTDLCKVVENEGIFERAGIWTKLEDIRNGKLNLNNGSYLIIDQTSAFLAIDVNSGNAHKVAKSQINLASCNEIVRFIKIFGIGGKILIDFLSCTREERKEIYEVINSSFSKDCAEHKIWGWTKGGIFELQRERDKTPFNLLIEDQ